jgi:hypothetical protein
MGMSPAMFGMDPNNINLNPSSQGQMNNFPMNNEIPLNMQFMSGMFPMMNIPQGGSPQQNN